MHQNGPSPFRKCVAENLQADGEVQDDHAQCDPQQKRDQTWKNSDV